MRVSSAASPLRILLIEDSKGDAILIEKALHQAMPDDCVIQTAETISASLQILAEHEFDVAILDRSLPDVIEYSGLHSIQNMAPKLPVIFLTAYKDETMALEAVEQGAQDYLFKVKLDGHVIRRSIQFSVIRKQFETVLILQANFDGLTKLANRMLFENRLDMAIARMKRHGGGLGILFLDLNRFKNVNDTFGHAVGDRLLVEVAKRLKASLRPNDTAARFGGDEFAMLIDGMTDVGRCGDVAQKIIALCEQPFVISGTTVSVGASIGITTCVAGQTISRGDLMQQADAAMYEAKASPESTYRFFSPFSLAYMSQMPRMTA